MMHRLLFLFALTAFCVAVQAGGEVWCVGSDDGKVWYQTTKNCCNAEHGIGTGSFNEWSKECTGLYDLYFDRVAACCRAHGAVARTREEF
ncbi:hypothetical protein FBU30_009258 [Linnemannia zychae]|nr:hypothetical protein FBU30_009258 [Linnemannia zychae]